MPPGPVALGLGGCDAASPVALRRLGLCDGLACGVTSVGLSGQLRTAYVGESNCLLETEGRGASSGALRELIPAQCPGCQWKETSSRASGTGKLVLRANASPEVTHLVCRLPLVYIILSTRGF